MWFADMSGHYKGTVVEQVRDRFAAMPGTQVGDPVKAATRIFEMVTATGLVGEMGERVRLPLGTDVLERVLPRLEQLRGEFEGLRQVAESIRMNE